MPEATIILEGADLIDGSGGPGIKKAVGGVDGAPLPYAGARTSHFDGRPAFRRNLSGKTIVPGLIEAHTHAAIEADMAAYVKNGVTTVRFAGLNPAMEAKLRDRIAATDLPAPRILSCG